MLHVSVTNRHPLGDITNEYTLLIHKFYRHSVKNIQNTTYKYNNKKINVIIHYYIYSSYFMYYCKIDLVILQLPSYVSFGKVIYL